MMAQPSAVAECHEQAARDIQAAGVTCLADLQAGRNGKGKAETHS
jgi:hypothetical protein